MSDTIVIWQFTDQKPGHENQSKGLIQAIKNRRSTESHRILIPDSLLAFIYALLNKSLYNQLAQLPKPTHLIAVGRRTHLPMLLAHWWFGGQRIVLSKPLWPKAWFDFLILPAHDRFKSKGNLLTTHGSMNNVTPSNSHDPNLAIILIGGPSNHYHWDSDKVIQQISELVESTTAVTWTIANSRRTPADFIEKLLTALPQLPITDYKMVDNKWLPSQLANAGQVWVSPDSVSMVYEALTSGAVVGCLMLKPKSSNNRIVNGLNALLEQNMLTSFEQWQISHKLTPPPQQLYEAQRAADWILNQ